MRKNKRTLWKLVGVHWAVVVVVISGRAKDKRRRGERVKQAMVQMAR